MERVVAGLQQRKVVTEKERRILAYHEAGHALMSHLIGDLLPVHKVTIVSRGQALGYTLNLPSEERYLHTKEEFVDLLKVYLAGRAAEQIVFGRVTNGAANDLEKATELARSMVFEYGMSDATASRTMRADNYALSEETKRLRDQEQARLTDEAYAEAIRLLQKHRVGSTGSRWRCWRRRRSTRRSSPSCSADVEPESRSPRETMGTLRVRGRRAPSPQTDQIASPGAAARDSPPRRRRRRPRQALSTYERLFGAQLEHRETVADQGVEAASLRVGAGRVELLASLGADTPVGKFLAKRGPGHAPRRLRGRRRRRGDRRARPPRAPS